MADNIFKTLGDYVTEVLDTNKDGAVSFKEFLGLFPNNSVAIAFLVVDLLVAVAEYRVWDVGLQITGGDPWKAIGFVLVSALPFYLAQILWLYPRAIFVQLAIAVMMGASALYTSAQFGLADLSRSYDVNAIIQMVVILTAVYIVALLVYVVIDPGVKAKRMKAKAKAQAEYQKEVNAITRSVLSDLRASLEEEQALKRDFDPVAVQAQLDRLRGGKGKQNSSSNNGARMPQNDTQRDSGARGEDFRPVRRAEDEAAKNGQHPVWKLPEFLQELDLTREQAEKALAGTNHHDEGYKALIPHGVERVPIGKSNFNNLYYQLKPKDKVNP